MSTTNSSQPERQPRHALVDLEPELQELTLDAAADVHGGDLIPDGGTADGATSDSKWSSVSLGLRKSGGGDTAGKTY